MFLLLWRDEPERAAHARLASLSVGAGAEERTEGCGTLTQRVPSCVLLLARGYSAVTGSLRLRKLIHISLSPPGVLADFLLNRSLVAGAFFSVFACLCCKNGKLASGRRLWVVFAEKFRFYLPDLSPSSSSSTAGVCSRLPHRAAGHGAEPEPVSTPELLGAKM